MPNMTAEALARHLRILKSASMKQTDERLLLLLMRAWPTKEAQDN
jgi:hypothetical protein